MTKYDKVLMNTATVWAELSSCKRKKVGAALSKDNRILNVAYNGTISGQDNACEIECEYCSGSGRLEFKNCRDIENPISTETCTKCQGQGIISNPNVVHAEKNLIAFCAKNGIPTDGCTVYVTLSPCTECSQLMAQAGIKAVVYNEAYRDLAGVELCESVGMDVRKYKEFK